MYSGSIYRNPGTLPCFVMCSSCYRCQDKGKYDKCNGCSGRWDEEGKRDPHDIDDQCRCKEGILQYRLKNGKMVKNKLPNDPFQESVDTNQETEDERDWESYLQDKREQLNDPEWDPIQFE